jgi:hypothetical protein
MTHCERCEKSWRYALLFQTSEGWLCGECAAARQLDIQGPPQAVEAPASVPRWAAEIEMCTAQGDAELQVYALDAPTYEGAKDEATELVARKDSTLSCWYRLRAVVQRREEDNAE